ncbi:VTT domain-containing protein [Martelella sp. HB161492]|uniref:DedA family protein n=1 Tax=Martelella sp. HB161492 TaxID=2720726 RepID=UPI00159080BE|nr:VTT domain-containing protein [Martelella sp. HB161492]
MIPLDTIITFLSDHGLWLVAFAAIFEGPIVTVLAAYLARQGIFDLWSLGVILVLADLVGDIGYYSIGRYGLHRLPEKWKRRMGLRPGRRAKLARHFRERGGRTLLFGKITHSAGSAILAAAGAARMPVFAFLVYNLIGTVPKTIALMVLGYFAGDAYKQIDSWIGRGSWIILIVLVLMGLVWFLWRRKCARE